MEPRPLLLGQGELRHVSELQNDLRRKGQLIIGDKIMIYAGEWQLLKPGDLAHTEGQDPDVLTCRRIEVQKRRGMGPEGKVFPRERGPKLYDLHEVVKVTFIDNPNLDKGNQPDERIIAVEPGLVEVHDTGSESDEGDRPEPNEHAVPREDLNERRTPRPVPRPPGRSGSTDYSSASSKRAAEASKRREPVQRDPGRSEQRGNQPS